MRTLFFLLVVCSFSCKAQIAANKVGYLDISRILAQLPEMKQMETKLVETRQQLQQQLATKQQDFQKLYTYYTTNAASMPDSTRQKVEAELQNRDADVQQFQSEAQNTIANTQKLYMAPIYLRLGKVIEEVAIENGYAMIIPTEIDGNTFILHADTKLDVSDLIVKKFSEVQK